jgi:transketolase
MTTGTGIPPALAAADEGEPGNDHLIFSKGHASPLVIVEDHYPQGGLGAAVLEALAGTGLPLRFRQCAVSSLPGSGTPDELMEAAGISASRIATAARELIKG